LRKVKIMVAAVATSLLVASPAFAADNGGVFTAETGFLQDTTLTGAGFDLTAGSITNNGFDNGDDNRGDNGSDNGGFFDNEFQDGFFDR
jgi:hypothetical protein